MKVDLLYAKSPGDWEGASYARALADQGLLNSVFEVEESGAEDCIRALEASRSDGIILLAADQYMAYLHDVAERADRIRSLKVPTLCVYGEPIIHNPIPWMRPRAERALAVYSRHSFHYEADAAFFADEIAKGTACHSLFAVDTDIFSSGVAFAQRIPQLLFTGKSTDFGLGDAGVYELRRALMGRLASAKLAHLHYDPNQSWPDYVRLLNRFQGFIILPGLNGLADGFSRKVFEVMGAGCLLIHPRSGAGSISERLFVDGRDCVRFDASGGPQMEAAIRELATQPAARLEAIAAAGLDRVRRHHTVAQRARALARWCVEGVPVLQDLPV